VLCLSDEVDAIVSRRRAPQRSFEGSFTHKQGVLDVVNARQFSLEKQLCAIVDEHSPSSLALSILCIRYWSLPGAAQVEM